MTRIEKLRMKLELIEDDASPAQLVKVLYDVIDLLEEKEKIGFNNEKET